jgi:hypothetical protein
VPTVGEQIEEVPRPLDCERLWVGESGRSQTVTPFLVETTLAAPVLYESSTPHTSSSITLDGSAGTLSEETTTSPRTGSG